LKNRLFALALSGAMFLSLTSCAVQNESTYVAPAGVAVQVQTVERTSIATDNRVNAKVASDNETNVFVPTNALCTAVYVAQGDSVEAGDKLCTLDLSSMLASQTAAQVNYQAMVDQYNNQKSLLEKQIALAENNLITTQKLFDIGAASKLEVDNAQLTLDQALMGRDSLFRKPLKHLFQHLFIDIGIVYHQQVSILHAAAVVVMAYGVDVDARIRQPGAEGFVGKGSIHF